MLGYFPTPYFDELWYSSCARFARHMRFNTETGVMLALYGRRHAIATVDLPHRLNALVCQLPIGHPSSISSIIDHQTFLPYYGPFLAPAMYRTARQLMEDGTKPSVRVRCGACTNRVRPPKFFRSCPECDRENRERLGETYWRRLFQLPGVEVCPSHKVFLESSDIRLDPLPAGCGQIHGLPRANKIPFRNHAIVDAAKHTGFSDQRSELLDQIKAERWSAKPWLMIETDMWIEADCQARERTILAQETVSQGKHDEDQVLFVSLGPAEGRGDRVITALGLPYTKLDAPCYVV